MSIFQRAILTHGGAGSDPQNFDGPQSAAKIGMDLMANGETALNAVVQAVRYLEDDPRFNAGLGSQVRSDNTTIQSDASCMTSIGEFAAVACIEGIQNPIDLARGILRHSPHLLIVGNGAKNFADENNIPMIPMEKADRSISPPSSCDTVGAVALSSGGLEKAAIGRVGDVPLPGCGLFCGPSGAVACTGDGEFIALKILAKEVYG